MREGLSKNVKGMVLFAPMVMIHPSVIPPKPVVKFLRLLAKHKPKAKLVPGDSKKLAEKCIRDPELLKRVQTDELIYNDTHRIGTGVQGNAAPPPLNPPPFLPFCKLFLPSPRWGPS